MQLFIGNQRYNIEKSGSIGNEILGLIMAELAKTGKNLSHLTVDGIEIYSDIEEFIMEISPSVKTIEAFLLSSDELFQETTKTALEYFITAIPSLNTLSIDISSGGSEEAWSQFSEMLNSAEWLLNFTRLFQVHGKHDHVQAVKLITISFEKILVELEEAMKNGDYGLVSNLIEYEIVPIYLQLSGILSKASSSREV